MMMIIDEIREALGLDRKNDFKCDNDLKTLKRIAIDNKVFALLSKNLSNENFLCYNRKDIVSWKMEAINIIVREQKRKYLISKIVEETNRLNIKLVFFKGIILANLYPAYYYRNSGDSDIYTDVGNRHIVDEMFRNLDYVRDVKLDKENVITYRYYQNDICIHKIELHFSLWEDWSGQQIDILESFRLTDESKYIHIDIEDMKVCSFGHTEHLIYQMYHLVKHFIFQGANIRYMLDIALFVNEYKNEIDYYDFWSKIEKLGYTKFCEVFFEGCVSLFDMDRSIIEKKNVETKLVDDLKRDLIELGTVGYGEEIRSNFIYLLQKEYYLEQLEDENYKVDLQGIDKIKDDNRVKRRLDLLERLELI